MIVVVTAEIAARALIGDVSAFTALLRVQHAREAEEAARQSEALAEKEAEAALTEGGLSEVDEIIQKKP